MTNNKKTVLVDRFDARKSRKGDTFGALTVNLGREGNFGQMPAKIWQLDRFMQTGKPMPTQGKIVQIVYREDEFQGAKQWTIEEYRLLEGAELEQARELFVQPMRIDKDFYRRRLEELIEEADPNRVCGRVLREVFDRAEFRERFYVAPAAKSKHQNYPGGLLEHTINVTTVALSIADAYARPGRSGLTLNCEMATIDRTLLISAGLLHDIGKIDTYAMKPLASFTDMNSFEGHLPISYAVARELLGPVMREPPYPGAFDEAEKLLNCILSHHGSLEFGSPVVPACIEAYILSQADVADARIAMIVSEGLNQLRQNPGARWVNLMEFQGGMFVGDWPAPGA